MAHLSGLGWAAWEARLGALIDKHKLLRYVSVSVLAGAVSSLNRWLSSPAVLLVFVTDVTALFGK